MIALLKAIPFGIFLTVIVCMFMGSGGATGGTLAIRGFNVDIDMLDLNFRMYWSWVLFLAGTFLAWMLILMMDN